MSTENPKFRIELESTTGGRLNYLTNEQEKAEAYFAEAKDNEVYVHGIFGATGEDGLIETQIDEFDRRPEAGAE